ncbi:ArsR/SmtB family transcription factor [Streptomyces acidiscabies]|uniref:Winged helix-turn-helix domain-containing protein n=1 Tax=Streptomyces acidiscabies TaxID=42234 RepID=A0AAP6EFR5_9ACTN|nr:winged helix-turn-helix domain-containing protein [Streptomyces acidiscabies]MBP5935961.1 winged helix-turn-helix transcriptional regulator [Streptomyces sp. LBUM 1476]MBZ3916124.1 winged helix-turn-helix transcriptional regulator [Streptomyces acidiscabies]MDX2960516.1 winged helix-turn-helix domain-containing protein [Streptomyces acidiscabies]MDX3017802.1 winged helix-turn-helix domain-containing protein [Streptomyces acidiscabies]MDX3791425.1 winged helix-turn-helix domain-containing pr
MTIASTGDPAVETALAADLLRRRSGGAIFGRWRDLVSQAAPLRLPSRPSVPDHLTLLAQASGAAVLRDWTGGRDSAADSDFFDHVLAPYWERVNAYLRADAEHRSRIFLGGGVEALLGTLHARIEWNSPVLELDNGLDGEFHPRGASLTVVPSLFLHSRPVVYTGGTSPVLVYPVPLDAVTAAALWDEPEQQDRALGALMGRTRASVLLALTENCTTTELGRRLGISAAAASQHTTVLRAAGLITSSRRLNAVVHSLTDLGLTLLREGEEFPRDGEELPGADAECPPECRRAS